MPTFRKNKKIKGLFSDEDICNAVRDVKQNGLSMRQAGRKYKIGRATISRYIARIKNGEMDEGKVVKLSMTTKQVFTKEEEESLAQYLVKASQMCQGLSKLQIKQLVFEFALALEKSTPANWAANNAAGEEWLKGFRRRNKTFSLKPEATSLDGNSDEFPLPTKPRVKEICETISSEVSQELDGDSDEFLSTKKPKLKDGCENILSEISKELAIDGDILFFLSLGKSSKRLSPERRSKFKDDCKLLLRQALLDDT